jgi:hypothetical protein
MAGLSLPKEQGRGRNGRELGRNTFSVIHARNNLAKDPPISGFTRLREHWWHRRLEPSRSANESRLGFSAQLAEIVHGGFIGMFGGSGFPVESYCCYFLGPALTNLLREWQGIGEAIELFG